MTNPLASKMSILTALFVITLLGTPLFGWTPKSDKDIWEHMHGYFKVAPKTLGIGHLWESLVDLGYKDEIIQNFKKSQQVFGFCFDYKDDGKGEGMIDITHVLGTIWRFNRDVRQKKEFNETLFDGRHATTTMVFDHPDNYEGRLKTLIFEQVIQDGEKTLNATYRYNHHKDGYLAVTTEVKGKSPRYYKLNKTTEYCRN